MFSAGPDQAVASGEPVGLQATESAVWTQTSGDPVTLSGAGARRTFTAPYLTADAVLGFQADAPSVVSAYGTNPGFDANATGWTAFGAAFARVTDEVHTGPGAGRLTVAGSTAYADVTYYGWIDAMGDVVTVSAWIRTPAAGTAAQVKLRGVSRDGGWGEADAGEAVVEPTNGAWRQVAVSFTAVTNDAELILVVENATEEVAVEIDDIELATEAHTDTCAVTVRRHDWWIRGATGWNPVDA